MATLYKRSKGVYRIQFRTEKRRGSITVRGSKAEAETLRGYISRLVDYKKRGLRPSADVLDWLRDLSAEFRVELAELGLVELGRVGGSVSDLVDYATRQLSELEERSRINYAQYAKSLKEYFGAGRPIGSISAGDAKEFRKWLGEKGRIDPERGYSPGSISKRIKYARQIFELAIAKEWLDRNPFRGIRVKVPIDDSRRYFVSKELTAKVLEELSSDEDRLVFALGRFAGFRIGSEIRSLRWQDVNFETRLLRVGDKKRKRVRTCPIFVELSPFIDRLWESAEPGADFVCPRFRSSTDQAFKSRVFKALTRLSIEAWPDLFLNLRRSRATEVVEQFGIKAESEWIGHGVEVSLRHYQLIEQATIDRAVGRVIAKKEGVEDEVRRV